MALLLPRFLLLAMLAMGCAALAQSGLPKAEYLKTALLKIGDPVRGKALFADEQRFACTRCHSIDASASKPGPDLFAIGDKFGRREIIEAILSPSTNIAVGYSTTVLETKAGDEFQGVIKQATPDFVEVVCGDGKRVRIATRDISTQYTSEISLMPEGLNAGLTTQEFTDWIDYLVTLKQPASANLVTHFQEWKVCDDDRGVRGG